MREIRYVLLDPTGNLTALVLDPVDPGDRAPVTAALMNRCEQVGYLTAAKDPRIRARLEMMGGEFCGNASMATAVYLAAEEGLKPGEEKAMLLEVSGAEAPVACRAVRLPDGWRGAAEMPLPSGMESRTVLGTELKAVFLPGMVHLIYEGPSLAAERAEAILRAAEGLFPEPAIGLLQWDRAEGRMIPLVRVRASGTQVWETACGSGTAAVAFLEAVRRNASGEIAVAQPGGVLRAETEWSAGRARRILLSGTVRLKPPEILRV